MLIKFQNTNFKEIEKMKINEYKINSDFSGNLIEIDGEHGEIKSLTEDRIYFILEGKGKFIVDGEKTKVEKNDLIFIPKNTFYNISGKMKYFLLCSPEFNAKNDVFLEDESEEKEQKIENIAFIDGQNLYKGSLDEGIDLDYYKFRHYLLSKFNVKKAFIFLGYIKSNEKLYSYLRKCGFELIFKKVTKDKNGDSKGNVDVDLTLETILRINEFDKAVLITSDGDFAPLVNHLKKENKYKQIISPSEEQCSHLLKQAVGGRILYLNNIVNKISKKKKRAADR